MLAFTTPNTSKWKLQELESIIDEFESNLCNVIESRRLKAHVDYQNIVLFTAGKSIVTFREVIALCSLGYPDGALSLARNLYEQFITLSFFEHKKTSEDFQTYIDDYFLDYDLQRSKNLVFEYEYIEKNELLSKNYKEELKAMKSKKAHQKVNGDYWWTGYSSFKKVVDFVIEKSDASFQRWISALHFTYKRSSVTLHASCLGNMIRLGNDSQFVGVDTAPSLKGQDIPLWFASCSFIMIVGVSCSVFEMEFEKYKERLNSLAVFYQMKHKCEDSEA